MSNKYFKISFSAFFLLASFAMIIPALAKSDVYDIYSDSIIYKTTLKLKDNRPNRPVFNTVIPSDFESFMFKMNSLNTGLSETKNISIAKSPVKNLSSFSSDIQKPIDNVKIYPNPVSDQLNLSYSLNKESMVTIKILDVLGNEVAVLLSQKLAAGDQTNTFYIDSKLNSGFYFVRVIAGSDSVIKRISVL